MARVKIIGNLAIVGLAVLALAAALATLINVITAEAPPNLGGKCNRKCIKGETMICLFEFDVHRYQTYSWACKGCENSSCSNSHECIKADGITRFITVVNKMLPGPSIRVCEGDTVKVTVKNFLPAAGVSIHWHGITMNDGTPYMDGEPGVSQCPIMTKGKFTYSFQAYPAGTHFWHAQTGFQRGDGVFGPLIVNQPSLEDPNRRLYDEDLSNSVIMINDWTHILSEEKFCLRYLSGFSDYPKSILINGLGPHVGNSITADPNKVSYRRFRIEIGKKYRFRVISAAFLNCPVTVYIDDHMMTVIATDGSSIQPRNVSSLLVHPGERWDVVVHADQFPQPYWIMFIGGGACKHDAVYQTAILDYFENNPRKKRSRSSELPYSKPKIRIPAGMRMNTDSCIGNNICMLDLRSSAKFELSAAKPTTHFLAFTRRRLKTVVYNHPFFFNDMNAPEDKQIPIPQINNFTFSQPPSPPSLRKNLQGICNSDYQKCEKGFCECVHLIKVPLGKIVDLVLINEDDEANVVHLHGYRFYVLAMNSAHINKKNFTRELLIEQAEQFTRNLENPVLKDTVHIPPNGYTIIRFLADNPGFWLLESQLLFYSQAGMKVVLQVGETHEIPDPPSNFPNCGYFP